MACPASHTNSGKARTTKARPSSGKPVEGLACVRVCWPVLLAQCFLVQVIPQHLRPGRVAELGHGLGFDLTDALTGNAVDLADFV